MKAAFREALAKCLARLEEGAEIEDCLRDQGPMAAEIRPLLEAAQALRTRRAGIEEPGTQAIRRGRARMHAARTRQSVSGRASIIPGIIFGRPAAVLAVAAVVALLTVLGFATDLFGLGADTTSADVHGVVSSVTPDVIVLTTGEGPVSIGIGEDTIVRDIDGNAITGDKIVPGKPAKVEVEKDNGGFVGHVIEVEEEEEGTGAGVEVEFSGVISSLDGSTITIQTSFGVAVVLIDSQTEIKGVLAIGAVAEVHATIDSGGSYLAREIEVKGIDHKDDGGHPDSGDPDKKDDPSDKSGSDPSGSGSGDGGDDHPDDGHEKES